MDLSYNLITSKGLRESLESLVLKKLNFSIDLSNNNLYSLCELDNFVGLRYLALRGNSLQQEQYLQISRLIKNGRSKLRILDIRQNKIDEHAAFEILTALEHNNYLEDLLLDLEPDKYTENILNLIDSNYEKGLRERRRLTARIHYDLKNVALNLGGTGIRSLIPLIILQ